MTNQFYQPPLQRIKGRQYYHCYQCEHHFYIDHNNILNRISNLFKNNQVICPNCKSNDIKRAVF